MLSISFYSAAIYIYDAPHWFTWTLEKFSLKKCRGDWYKLVPLDYQDVYFFDLGYFFAFAVVVYSIGIFFSTIAPIIPLICCMYFFIMYWVHKYNLVTLYKKEFDTYQPFGTYACNICVLLVFIARMFNFMIIRTQFDPSFARASWIFLAFEVLALIFYLIIGYAPSRILR